MNRYVLYEIAAFASLSAILFALFPNHNGFVYLAIIGLYGALQVVSAMAFCRALHAGAVIEHAPAPYRYSVASKRRPSWLALRHLHTYLRQI